MHAIALRSLKGELHKVAAPWQRKPALALKHIEQKFGFDPEWLYNEYGSRQILDCCQRFSLKSLTVLSFDELCKFWHSSTVSMDQSVKDFFETSANHEIVRKIENSIWRWGVKRSKWNEVVDAYNCLRNFKFPDIAGFEVTLDHTTYHNDIGHSKYSRTFLDGVFAYLVHYRGEHVLTIGFSIMDGREVMIQQIQSAKQRGNRHLYHLPNNLIEFVIDLFWSNFPGYTLYLVDGLSLAHKTIANYKQSLTTVRSRCKRYRIELALRGWMSADNLRFFAEDRERCKELQRKIARLRSDEFRLGKRYAATGRFVLECTYECRNQLSYRRIGLPKEAVLQAA